MMSARRKGIQSMTDKEAEMAAKILNLEDARVSGAESLRITRLPAADKGGTWEICGICDGIEPSVYNELATLLRSGKRRECWERCLRYVTENTAAVRRWLGSDRFPAVEFYCRDFYFNAGGKPVARSLQRSLRDLGENVAADGVFGVLSQEALRRVTEESGAERLLPALRKRRDAYYRACRQFGVFGKGWLARSAAAYAYAQTL